MANVKIVLIEGAPEKLRKLEVVRADLEARAQRMADAAGGDGYEVDSMIGATRARASVAAKSIDAQIAEATDHTLLNAIDAGR